MEFILWLIGISTGYYLAKAVSGRFEGDKPEKSLRILIGKNYVHLHHWFYSLIILLVLYKLNVYHPAIYGFFLGLILQGLTYSDRFRFFYTK